MQLGCSLPSLTLSQPVNPHPPPTLFPLQPSPATSTQPPTTCFFLVSKANFFLHTPTHTPHPFYLQVDGLQWVSSTDDYLRSATTCRPFLLNWSPIFFRQRMSHQILTVNYFYRASAWLLSWLRFSPNDQHSLHSQWQQNQACSAWCCQTGDRMLYTNNYTKTLAEKCPVTSDSLLPQTGICHTIVSADAGIMDQIKKTATKLAWPQMPSCMLQSYLPMKQTNSLVGPLKNLYVCRML